MNPSNHPYLKKLLLITAATGILMLIAFLTVPQHLSPALPFVLIFFMSVSLLSYSLLQKKASSGTSGFVNGFMTHSVLRMALYLAIILGYAFLNREDAVKFIIGFFVIYLIFTIFEVFQFLALTRKSKPTGKQL
jgi:hypothetical protein